MNIEEIENTFLVIKWVYPIISFCFFSIVSLLIYIWKTNTTRTDKILEQTNKTLDELKTMVAINSVEIKNIKEKAA